MSDHAIRGTHFAWTRGLMSLVPVVFHDGILKSDLGKVIWKTPLTKEEQNLPLDKLASKYPISLAIKEMEK